MKLSILPTLAAIGTLAVSTATYADNTQNAEIKAVLSTYGTALNAQDTNTIVALYAEDAVFMPQHNMPQVGLSEIRASYEGIFNAFTLDVDFKVDEVELLSEDWAFARTRSEGFVKINATGANSAEANQELFLFHRSNEGDWKISRYIFSTTNPPRN